MSLGQQCGVYSAANSQSIAVGRVSFALGLPMVQRTRGVRDGVQLFARRVARPPACSPVGRLRAGLGRGRQPHAQPGRGGPLGDRGHDFAVGSMQDIRRPRRRLRARGEGRACLAAGLPSGASLVAAACCGSRSRAARTRQDGVAPPRPTAPNGSRVSTRCSRPRSPTPPSRRRALKLPKRTARAVRAARARRPPKRAARRAA